MDAIVNYVRQFRIQSGVPRPWLYTRALRKRSELTITLADDNAIAAAAMIGDSNNPKTGSVSYTHLTLPTNREV